MWMDHRAVEQASSITNTGHKVLSRVGGVMSPEMQPPKLLWLKEVRGERGHRRRLVSVGFCFSSYWVFRAKQGGALAYYDCNSLCLFFFSNPEPQRKLLGQSCSLFWPAWLFVLESNRFFDQVNLLSWIDVFVELIFLKKLMYVCVHHVFPGHYALWSVNGCTALQMDGMRASGPALDWRICWKITSPK